MNGSSSNFSSFGFVNTRRRSSFFGVFQDFCSLTKFIKTHSSVLEVLRDFCSLTGLIQTRSSLLGVFQDFSSLTGFVQTHSCFLGVFWDLYSLNKFVQTLPHSVEKWKIYYHRKNPSNHLFVIFSLEKQLISRNSFQTSVEVNCRNFHTVQYYEDRENLANF